MSKKRRTRTDQSVARMTTPGQVAATVPLMMGFWPHESLVVLCGHEPRGRIGLSFRLDLPGPEQERAAARLVEQHVRQDGATRYSLLVFSEQPGELPHEEFVDLIRDRLVHLREMEVLLVRGGRWFSYTCSNPCCPPEGTPLAEDEHSAPVTLVAAEKVLRGEVMAASREELAATLAGPTGLAARIAEQQCRNAGDRLADRYLEVGAAATDRELAQLWDGAVMRFASPPADLGPDEAATLAISLDLAEVRDHVTSADEADRPAVLALLAELMRRTPAPFDGVVSAAYGWLTYLEGGGALASIAADRALASDPAHSLVLLLDDALRRAVPPDRLRELVDRNRRRLTA